MPVENPVFSGDQVRNDGFGIYYESVNIDYLRNAINLKALFIRMKARAGSAIVGYGCDCRER
jgi:hypothetical protein